MKKLFLLLLTCTTLIGVSQQKYNFVQSKTLGTLRNNYSGWVGTNFYLLGPTGQTYTVTSLGRIFVTGNVHSHTLKLVDASTGLDVPGGSATWLPKGTNGQFSYVSLDSAIVLANGQYYLVSDEVSGEDKWYDNNTAVTAMPFGGINEPVYSSILSPQNWLFNGSVNHSYGPVDFQFEISTSNFIQSKTLGTLRNDYSGWVGMVVQTGEYEPLIVTALGRIFVTGNVHPHTLKLVYGSGDYRGTDVPGGSVTWLPNGTNGQFSYASLQEPIELSGTVLIDGVYFPTFYYVVSDEVSGEDEWYDNNTAVTPASGTRASIPSPVYSSSSSPQDWLFNGSANHSYGPVDFQYDSNNDYYRMRNTTGINALTKANADISVFPNPSNGQMTVQLAGNGYTLLKISNLLGREVYTQVLSPDQTDLNLNITLNNGLSHGIYLLQVTTPSATINKRLVLQ